MLKLIAISSIGLFIGFGVGFALPAKHHQTVWDAEVRGWLKAHAQRDREDEKVRQDIHKILNRLALMGAIPRHKK